MGGDNRLWAEVSFRDASNKILAMYRTEEFGSSWGLETWFQLFVTNVCDISNNNVVTGHVAQLTAPPGTSVVRFQVVHYQVNNGGGSGYFDDGNLNQISGPVPPVLSNLVPGSILLASASAGLSFTVSSPSSTPINNSGIHVTLNGTDVSTNLVITGTATSKNVAYAGLASNQTYGVSITVTDTVGLSISSGMIFDTISPQFVWEAEDFDYTNGLYIDNPQLSATNDNPISYFGKVGVEGVDEHDASGASGDHFYRLGDPMATTYSGDFQRKKFVDAAVNDFKVGWFNGGEWVNYTRTYPAGTFNIVGRLAGGEGAAKVTLSVVNSDQTTTDLGVFSFTGTGWSTYNYVPLTDANGNTLAISLGGKKTLRATTGGGADMNFFMLMPAQVDRPVLADLYPTGTHPFEPTNTFSFSVTSPGPAINAGDIHLWLNGADVSTRLVVGGSATARNVTCPVLVPNVLYSAVLAVTNVNGTGVRVTNLFDTFSQTNLMVEAEDYDFDGGQFIDNPTPVDYFIKGAVEGVDFSHTKVSDERFNYRIAPGIPTQATSDYLRQKYIDLGGAGDYNLAWFGYPDWCNYTHNYPTGNYIVYGRFGGNGGYSMYLDKVVSGAGTTNQLTQRLGRWGAVGRGWQVYDWVPLTDEGLACPVVVKLNGLTTLRIVTTGNCNPNFFMLVPTSGIQVSAAKSAGSVALSFPTQVGLTYRVFYKTDPTAGNWTLLSTVAGDGTAKTVLDPVVVAQRFYQVVAP